MSSTHTASDNKMFSKLPYLACYLNLCQYPFSWRSLPLKRQEKMHLKISSSEVVCCKKLPNITDELCIEANSVGPEQTAPVGAV